PQEIADIAVYLQGLPTPAGMGRGPGSGLDRGKELYQRPCEDCHGERGEGDADKFYPRVGGQPLPTCCARRA
ncbi:MAG: c-type cytochrome, partial [Thiohalocapsa sp.]